MAALASSRSPSCPKGGTGLERSGGRKFACIPRCRRTLAGPLSDASDHVKQLRACYQTVPSLSGNRHLQGADQQGLAIVNESFASGVTSKERSGDRSSARKVSASSRPSGPDSNPKRSALRLVGIARNMDVAQPTGFELVISAFGER